jgi:hypothetical protein
MTDGQRERCYRIIRAMAAGDLHARARSMDREGRLTPAQNDLLWRLSDELKKVDQPELDPDEQPDQPDDDDRDDDDELRQSTRTCPACGGLGRLKDGTRCTRCRGSGRIGRDDFQPGDRSGGTFSYGNENLDDWSNWNGGARSYDEE